LTADGKLVMAVEEPLDSICIELDIVIEPEVVVGIVPVSLSQRHPHATVPEELWSLLDDGHVRKALLHARNGPVATAGVDQEDTGFRLDPVL